MIVRLPASKLDRLRREIHLWEGRKSCTKRELLSIIGQLQHACYVIKPGRSFLRQMIELSKGVHELHYQVHLNTVFRSDLYGGAVFSQFGMGLVLCLAWHTSSPRLRLLQMPRGPGVVGHSHLMVSGFSLCWPSSWDKTYITAKELLPIVLGTAVWGSAWKGCTVLCLSDNAAVVAIVNSGQSKMDRAMHLMKCLSFFLARWGISLVCRHLPGFQNGAADALSRNALPSFQRLVPHASSVPSAIPDNLLQCLALGMPDWTKVDWFALFDRSL